MCARSWESEGTMTARGYKYWVRLNGPTKKPLYSERNRFKCWVAPLGRGWRLVIRWQEENPDDVSHLDSGPVVLGPWGRISGWLRSLWGRR